jgi:hypothetical protein
MGPPKNTLAARLGVTTPITSLQFRLARLIKDYPSPGATTCEDWLLDVANVRGASFITRNPPRNPAFQAPPESDLSNEELVAAICRTDRLDRPQMLRAAAQLISQGRVASGRVVLAARREQADRVLAELARQALRVHPSHPVWSEISNQLALAPAFRSPIMHWSRLAVPIPDKRGINAVGWRLIA